MTFPMTLHHRTSAVGEDGRPVPVVADVRVRGSFRSLQAWASDDMGQVSTDDYQVYLRPTDPLAEIGDQLTLDGQTYDVVAASHLQRAFGRNNLPHHSVLRVRRSVR